MTKFSTRLHLNRNFAKGREKQQVPETRFCLKRNNQFTALGLEGTSFLKTNNVTFYLFHINGALTMCIQMKQKHEWIDFLGFS